MDQHRGEEDRSRASGEDDPARRRELGEAGGELGEEGPTDQESQHQPGGIDPDLDT
jgi:hypothetical protein